MTTGSIGSATSIHSSSVLPEESSITSSVGKPSASPVTLKAPDGRTISVQASVQEKTDSSSPSELAARIEKPADNGGSHGIWARLKSVFSSASKATPAEPAPAKPSPTVQLAEKAIADYHERHPELSATADNIKARAEKLVLPAALEAAEFLETAEVRGDRITFNTVAKNKINAVMKKFEEKIKANPDDIKGISKASKALNKNLEKAMVEAYEMSIGADEKPLTKSEAKIIKHEFRAHMKELVADKLNRIEDHWQAVSETSKLSKEAQIELGADPNRVSGEIEFTATRTPASKHPTFAEDFRKDGRHGISSMSTSECERAVNLAQTTFKGNVTNYKGTTHGVNFPFGIKNDPETAEKGADRRTEDTIRMVASGKAEEIEKWVLEHPDEPFPLDIVSTSLLTAASKAKTYENGQQAAWARAQGVQTIKVELPNHGVKEVAVDVNVLPFSLGVNGFAKIGLFSGSIGKHLGNFLTGWKWADNHNRPLFDKLDGMAHKAQAQALKDGDNGKALRIQDYRDQLSAALADGKQRRSAGNAYGVAVLVQLIANESGAGTAINCMSGKDRTGYLDGKIRARLEEVEALNSGRDPKDASLVPQIYGESTEAQKALLSKATQTYGGLSGQRDCTYLAGYKVTEGGVARVRANEANVLDSKQLVGLSGAVKA